MSTAIKRRRGTAAEHSSFAGLEGELTVNTTNKSVHVHDGTTAGGHELARADLSNVDNITPTSTGIDVTGTATMDGLTVDGGAIEVNNFLTAFNLPNNSNQYMDVARSFYVNVDSDNNSTAEAFGVTFDNRSKKALLVQETGDISFYEDTGTTAKFFWDASAESLGIGRQSFTAGTYTNHGLIISQTDGIGINDSQADGVARLTLKGESSTGDGVIDWGGNGNFNLRLTNNGSERMRIDSSGNLLVGKTSDAFSVEGTLITPDNVFITTNGDQPLALNRLTSDGNIVEFYKDGTAVGSIGTKSGQPTIGQGGTALVFDNSAWDINPFNVATNDVRDAAINLGSSSARFNNLYLSGGVYLGGTGAANKLDDYETGTWTPTVGALGITIHSATYTKIGQRVFFELDITMPTTSDVSNMYIGGLPFNVVGNGSGSMGYANSAYTTEKLLVQTTTVYFYGNANTAPKRSDFSGTVVRLSGHYIAV